jgi:hypothetical protein
MTQTDFIRYVGNHPNRVNVWYSETGPPYTIYGISIPEIDLRSQTASTYLKRVTEVSFKGSISRITLEVESNLSGEASGIRYYILLTKPYEIDSIGDLILPGVNILLSPSFDITAFEDGPYNALGGTVETPRKSSFIMQSDRYKVGTLTNPTYTGPLNIEQLLSGSADRANIQDSNYSSLSWLRSRYEGSKTSRIDYKVEAALTGRTFLGADFSAETELTQIQYLTSSNQVEYKDLFYAGKGQVPGFDLSTGTGLKFASSTLSGYSETATILDITNASVNTAPSYTPTAGDIIANNFTTADPELMKIERVTVVVPSNPPIYRTTVIRGYLSNSGSISQNQAVSTVKPVQIYNIDGNKLSGVSKSKVLVRETGQILGVDSLGYVVSST